MNPTILLIEDNEQNRYLATFLLEKHGYRVVPAEDGCRGIDVARAIQPDLILLDMQLPAMDGYEVVRALRELEIMRQIPIIAVTAYAMVGDREKALKAGCSGYIEKPINPETFVGEIQKISPPRRTNQEFE